MDLALFTLDGDALVPTEIARSMWSRKQMHGVAISGALARGLERHLGQMGRDDLRAARYTVDLFRPALMEPCTVEVETMREGRRIALLDATMHQGGERVARASCVFLLPSESAPGDVWEPSQRTAAPSTDEVPASEEPRVPFFASQGGWSQTFGEHQNASRKQTWQTGLPVVAGESNTPFQTVASIADSTSMLTNWGTRGVLYINTDITLALARPPSGLEVGLAVVDRVEHDGIAVGSVAVFDREGPLGTAMVTALANAQRPVDFEGVEYSDDGRRQVREPAAD